MRKAKDMLSGAMIPDRVTILWGSSGGGIVGGEML